MSNDLFIDGLKPRQSRRENLDSSKMNQAHFSSGHVHLEFGDSTTTRSSRREINKIVEETKLVKKTPVLKNNPTPKFNTTSSTNRPVARPKSYARDVLGISDDEIELNSEELVLEHRARRRTGKATREPKFKKFIFQHKFLSFIIAPAAVFLFIAFFWGNSILLRITNGQSGIFDFLRTAASGNATLKTGADGRTNVLIFGTSGYDMSGREGDGVHDGAQLTDSIMVLSIDQASKDVAMISLPRDLKTKTCTIAEKINELYFCANPRGDNESVGANALKTRVESILGLELQYYIHLNWLSLIQIVDAIGGITVTVDNDISDDMTGTFLKAGIPANLNGERALGLARARHGTVNGDFTRGESQQKIIIAIKNKISAMNFGIPEIINLANILGENIRSDLNSDTIYAGAKILSSTNFESIRQIPLIGADNNYLTTGNIKGISYVYPVAGVNDYSKIQSYLKGALTKNPLILENAKVAVLNGSGVDGAAAIEQQELEKANFKVSSIGNAPAGQYFEKIYLYQINSKPATKEKLETYYNTKALSKESLPSGITLDGVDFVVILGVGYSIE